MNNVFETDVPCEWCKNSMKGLTIKTSSKTRLRRFCSQSCSASYNNSVKPKRTRKKWFCQECRQPTTYRRKFCDDCYREATAQVDMTLAEATYRKHTGAKFAKVRDRARRQHVNPGCICEHCGYSKHVEVCHIRAISDFPPDAMLSTINARDNILLLCPNCHWEHDHGL